jgi:uncharacterized protein (DUF305 family)
VVIAVLAAGCARSDTNQPTASDEADVRFMQQMAGHLLQTTSILDLTQDRITRPKLARLADTINQQGQAHLVQLQAWLATRGLASYDPQQQPRNGKETDLQRLSRVHKAIFDLAFVKVMTTRHRAGSKLAAAELRDGTLPEVRQLAQQLLATQQAQIATMTAWARAWSKAHPTPPDGQTSRPSVSGRPAVTLRG